MTGIVLAGGRSRRMGMAKALLRLDGETFLQRAVSLLSEICGQVIISAGPDLRLPAPAGYKIIVDQEPGLGPLGGLVSSLEASNDDWHLALACDLPLARPELLRLLAENATAGPRVDAVLPRAGGRLQPLLAVYSRTCLEPAREALARGERAVAAMLDRVKTRILEEELLCQADPDLVSFTNVNTWEEYRALRARSPERLGCG